MRLTERQIVALLFLLFSFGAFRSIQAQKPPAEGAHAPDYSKEPYVIEKDSTKVVFENDGTYSIESTARVHIQSQAGVQGFGLLNFPYPSATASMEVMYVHVIKPDNRIVETPSENVLDMPADITRQAPFYSDLKERQVAVKGLETGDTLEFQYHEQVKTPLAPGQFWFSYNFFQDGIVLQEELQISVPHDRYVKVQSPKIQPTTTELGAYRVFTWETANLTRKPETKDTDSSAQEEPQFPSVQLTTFRSWDEVGQWFRSLAAPRAVPTPEIQAKANELTRDAKTDSDKIQALYNFVSTKYRYIGISLGIGRYQPHAAADVLTNDYGDCKDKHTLFAALLAAVGVKAYPALISSGEQIDADVPSPSQFDHVITVLPQEKGFLFLDTTPEVAPFGLLMAGLRDKKALLIPDNGPAVLVQTPPDPPFKSYFTFQADGALDDTGTLESKMQITLRGDDELLYRATLRQAGQPQWKDVVQQISSNLGFGGTVSDVDASAPDATDVPFHIEYSYNRKEYSDWPNKRITPPFPPIFLPVVPDDADKSSKPIKLGSPTELLYQATIKLPANSNPSPPPSLNLDESFAEYHAMYSASNGAMHFERRLITKAHKVAPGQIESYRNFVKAIIDDENTFFPISGAAASSGRGTVNPLAQRYFQQGQEAIRQGNMPGARDAFQGAVDLDPKFALGWMMLGDVHIRLQSSDQGIEEMKKGITLDPTQVPLYKYLGSQLMAMGRQEEALEVWKGLETANPQNADAPKNIASILSNMKRYPEAVTELETATSRNPENSGLLLSLGDAYLHSGKAEKAIPTLQKALDLDSTADTLNAVAYELADNKLHLEDALGYAEKSVQETEKGTTDLSLDNLTLDAIQTVPKLASFWGTLGWIHFQMGHFDLAEKYLSAGWSLTQDATIADHLGQLYEKQGKKSEAEVAYSDALSAGHAPEGTAARLGAVRPRGNPDSKDGERLQNLRMATVKNLDAKPSKHASADFFLLFAPGPKIVDVRFVSGSEELHTAEKTLTTLKFDVQFPDDNPVQILRRGILDCEPEIPGCTFALYPPSSVYSVK